MALGKLTLHAASHRTCATGQEQRSASRKAGKEHAGPGRLHRGAVVRIDNNNACGRVLESRLQADAGGCADGSWPGLYTVCVVEQPSGAAVPEFSIEKVDSEALSAVEPDLLEQQRRRVTGTILKTESTARRGLDGRHVTLEAVETAAEAESCLDQVTVSDGRECVTISAVEFLPDIADHGLSDGEHGTEQHEPSVPAHLLLARPVLARLKNSRIAESYGVSCEQGTFLATPQLRIPGLVDGKFIQVDADDIAWPASLQPHLPYDYLRAQLALRHLGGAFTDAPCAADESEGCSVSKDWSSWYRYQGL